MKAFEQVIDGRTWFCVACSSEAERAALLGAPPARAPAALAQSDDGTRAPGRPSFAELIAAAAQAIEGELEGLPTIAARARRVLRQIAEQAAPEDIPSTDTVARWLRDRPARQNSRQNFPQKSSGSKLKSGG